MAEPLRCYRCNCVEAESFVELWDTHNYCNDCAGAALPSLRSYTMDHSSLTENVPERVIHERCTAWYAFTQSRRWRRNVVVHTTILVLLQAVIVAFTGAGALDWMIYGTLTFVALSVGPRLLMLHWGLAMHLRGVRHLQAVTVEDGVVTFKRKKAGLSFPLDRSAWIFITPEQASKFWPQFHGDGLLLVQCIPKGYGEAAKAMFCGHYMAWCGFDDECRERWIAFLSLAGIKLHRLPNDWRVW